MRQEVQRPRRPSGRVMPALLALAVTLLVAGCIGGGNADAVLPSPDPGAVVISAHSIAFDRTTLLLPAGKSVELAFDNFDGVPHNVAVYADSSASKPLFVGQIFSGPGQRVYHLPPLAAGTYYFRCDVHPQMSGMVEVR